MLLGVLEQRGIERLAFHSSGNLVFFSVPYVSHTYNQLESLMLFDTRLVFMFKS